MKYRLPTNAVKAEIDSLFKEWVLTGVKNKKVKKKVFRPINTRDKEALNAIAENRLGYYLKAHLDNTVQLFIDTSIEKAIDYQTYFPDYKTNAEHKTYYFTLNRWIEFLQNDFQKHQIKETAKLITQEQNVTNVTLLTKKETPLFSKISLTLKQVALIHIYEAINILDPRTDHTRAANEIAASYQFKSATSGQQLYDKFRELDGGSVQRTGVKGTKQMIKDIEVIIPLLNEKAQTKAKQELIILKERRKED